MKTTDVDYQMKYVKFHSVANALRRYQHLFLVCMGLCFVVIFLLYICESELYLQHRLPPTSANSDENERYLQPTERQWKRTSAILKNESERKMSVSLRNRNTTHERKRSNHEPNFHSQTTSKHHAIKNNSEIAIECLSLRRNLSYVPPIRLVHFDLKGAPPKVEYFKRILPILKASGATGILMEYEDMFPFWGVLSPAAAPNAYSKQDVVTILNLAQHLDLEVIPLVQTFGHMEFVLKLPQFEHLRETDESPSAICPSNQESFELVAEIVDQVISLHPRSKWIHIGCDEVFYMGICSKCNKYVYQKDILFLQHVTKIARYVRKKHKVIPIIWDDMIRRTSPKILQTTHIGSLVEPMIWVYAEDVRTIFFPSTWHRYRAVFRNVWAASAFKGAFGRDLAVPNVQRHLHNHVSWLSSIASKNKTPLRFQGLALTGWQRYEHFGPLCELLPAGIPSLVLNLLTVSHGCYWSDLIQKMRLQLNCTNKTSIDDNFVINKDPLLLQTMQSCSYPGSEILQMAGRYMTINESLYNLFNEICNLNTHNVNIEQVQKELQDLMNSLNSIYYESRTYLAEVYDMLTVTEWMTQNLKPLGKKTSELWRHTHLFNTTTHSDVCITSDKEQTSKRIIMI